MGHTDQKPEAIASQRSVSRISKDEPLPSPPKRRPRNQPAAGASGATPSTAPSRAASSELGEGSSLSAPPSSIPERSTSDRALSAETATPTRKSERCSPPPSARSNAPESSRHPNRSTESDDEPYRPSRLPTPKPPRRKQVIVALADDEVADAEEEERGISTPPAGAPSSGEGTGLAFKTTSPSSVPPAPVASSRPPNQRSREEALEPVFTWPLAPSPSSLPSPPSTSDQPRELSPAAGVSLDSLGPACRAPSASNHNPGSVPTAGVTLPEPVPAFFASVPTEATEGRDPGAESMSTLPTGLAGAEPARASAAAPQLASGAPNTFAPTASGSADDLPLIKERSAVKRYAVLGAAGAALVLGIVLVAVSGSRTGTLAVTVAEQGGAAVPGAEVFVDGQRRCERAPCKVEELSRGTHRVRVTAPGYIAGDERPMQTKAGEKTELTFALVRERPKIAAPPPEQPVAEPQNSASDRARESAKAHVDKQSSPARTGESRVASAAQAKVAQPVSAQRSTKSGAGSLSISSRPVGMVYVDGRVIGETPKQLKLPAGTHTVTVINPDFGSRSQKVTIEAGKSASVRLKL
jgi:hypothetical protein